MGPGISIMAFYLQSVVTYRYILLTKFHKIVLKDMKTQQKMSLRLKTACHLAKKVPHYNGVGNVTFYASKRDFYL